ncbi:MAG: hypothetical protein S4CHLAM123_06730 [Chlamydiales bacterium]|nr:hypothetical protein [Chlamydiales bacterium]
MKSLNDLKVVIIGAGLAGLTAAYRLQNEGVDIHLYEARDRVGGRVLTVNVNGNIAELGGQNIADGGEAAHITRLIHEFGFEVRENYINLDPAYFNGENLAPVNELLKNKKFDPETLKSQLEELASSSDNMKEVLGGLIEETDPLYEILAVRLAAYEGASIEKLSPFYAETLFHMLLGGICAVHQGNEEKENSVELVSIKEGNATLPQKIAEILGPRLHLNMALTKVSKKENNTFTLTFQDGEEVNADILILAMPCSVYEQIAFEESVIPLDRLRNIESVQYGTNAKILVPFDETPSKKTAFINNQITSFFESARNILTLYCTEKMSVFSHETILNTYAQVSSMVEMGFGKISSLPISPVFAEDRAFATYSSVVGYSWPNDPHVRGSYSYISPGQEGLLTDMTEEQGEKFKTLFAPIGQKLYFAGEHASILMEVSGTMEAACESGERVARAILKK